MLFKKEKRLINTTLNTGFGFVFENCKPGTVVVPVGLNLITGRLSDFFETGINVTVVGPDVMLLARIGYRKHFNNRILFRIAYTPYFWLPAHIDTEEYPKYTGANTISVSLGYRF